MDAIQTTRQLMTQQQVQAYATLRAPARTLDVYDHARANVAPEGQDAAELVNAMLDAIRAAFRAGVELGRYLSRSGK